MFFISLTPALQLYFSTHEYYFTANQFLLTDCKGGRQQRRRIPLLWSSTVKLIFVSFLPVFSTSLLSLTRTEETSSEQETEWLTDLYIILAEDIILKSTIKLRLFYTARQTWWVFTIVAL